MLIIKIIYNLLILIIISSPSLAWAGADANDLYAAEQWPEATAAYTLIVSKNPDDGMAGLRLAASARKAGRYDVALNAVACRSGTT